MIDDILGRRKRRHVKDLNIVPILDMLTTIIFFLLLSAGFTEYTKLTLPPAATSTIRDPAAEDPVSPKMLLTRVAGAGDDEGEWALRLSWKGKDAGQDAETLREPPASGERRRKALMELSAGLVRKLQARHPGEKTLQLGLGPSVSYQDLLSVMDGARPMMPDVVLVSYAETEAEAAAAGAADAAAKGDGR